MGSATNCREQAITRFDRWSLSAMLQQVGTLEFIDASSGIRLCALL